MPWGVARTLTARYFKNSVANFLRHDGMGNTGVMVIYDSENRQRQVDALRIGGGATDNRRYSNAPAVEEVTAADGCSGSRWATARHRTR